MPSGMTRAGRALAELYPRALALFVRAPWIMALVVVPEFVQHVVEIRLGMFADAESFRAASADPARMRFGYAKLAGLVLAMLAAARWWWTRERGGHWADPRDLAWSRLLAGLVVFIGVPSLAGLAEGAGPGWLYHALAWGTSIAVLPMLWLLLAGLFGDRATPLASMWTRGWPWLLLCLLLLVLAFAPAQWLHQSLHGWALGRAPAAIWTLMGLDALLVGLLAGLVGTALYLGYEAFVASGGRPADEAPGLARQRGTT